MAQKVTDNWSSEDSNKSRADQSRKVLDKLKESRKGKKFKFEKINSRTWIEREVK